MKLYTLLFLLSLGTLSYGMGQEAPDWDELWDEAGEIEDPSERRDAQESICHRQNIAVLLDQCRMRQLEKAVKENNVYEQRRWLSSGADVNGYILDDRGELEVNRTLLYRAVNREDVQSIKTLLSMGADPEKSGFYGYARSLSTPLIRSVEANFLEGVRLLLPLSSKGFIVDDKDGPHNVLYKAIAGIRLNPALVLFLLMHGGARFVNSDGLPEGWSRGATTLEVLDDRGETPNLILVRLYLKFFGGFDKGKRQLLSEAESDGIAQEIIATSSMAPTAKWGNIGRQVLDRQYMSSTAMRAQALKARAKATQKQEARQELAKRLLPTHYLV